jgi:hypothetical protein
MKTFIYDPLPEPNILPLMVFTDSSNPSNEQISSSDDHDILQTIYRKLNGRELKTVPKQPEQQTVILLNKNQPQQFCYEMTEPLEPAEQVLLYSRLFL